MTADSSASSHEATVVKLDTDNGSLLGIEIFCKSTAENITMSEADSSIETRGGLAISADGSQVYAAGRICNAGLLMPFITALNDLNGDAYMIRVSRRLRMQETAK
jgi:hypothetical protein